MINVPHMKNLHDKQDDNGNCSKLTQIVIVSCYFVPAKQTAMRHKHIAVETENYQIIQKLTAISVA